MVYSAGCATAFLTAASSQDLFAMPDLLKMFAGFLIGFSLFEWADARFGGDVVEIGAILLRGLITAAIATGIVTAVRRFRRGEASPSDSAE